ncbi:MAG: recombinase zinc beta ribbon domain-containing protein, partial [Oscillospiraceae bacterium]|nr:recombinase zinc beta ribbon domain-containing protein [Oscillospiraceae bacterium]
MRAVIYARYSSEPDLFDKCQKWLAENKHRPASFKTTDDKYLLTGKIFCGHCNATMSGESGTSKTGTTHRYYHCSLSKKKRACDKKRVNKDLIENTAVNTAIKLFENKSLIKRIVDNCFNLQSTKSTRLPALKSQLKQTTKEIDNVMNAIKAGIITKTTKSTLERLEQEQESLEIAIAKENVERPIISKEKIRFWIIKFAKTDISDTEQKQRLINAFVNAVFVY